MKKIYILALLVLYSAFIRAQNPATDTIVPAKGNVKEQLKEIKNKKIAVHSDSAANEPKKIPLLDTTKYNKYGSLLNDDPKYNQKYPLWKPAVEVVGENVLLNILDRTVMNLEFSKTDFHTWGRTTGAGFPWVSGWEWDQDRFGNNFLSHPMMGSFYYSAARSNGYNFWESAPIVFAGSYMWKIFGENGKPEREDLINTTFDGIALGEILYRLSSNILDDRSIGRERVFREILAGVIDPVREFNRLLQGKAFRRTNKEVYQTEPLNITLFAGVNDEMLDLQLDYGNPFEDRRRKPFDLFRFRAELNFGVGRKLADNVTGYGILFGKNAKLGKIDILYGAFQYYDYFDTKAFELSTIGFGGGLFTKIPVSKQSNLYTNFHLALVPFGGVSVGPVSDTAQFRDYRFAYGIEGKIETSLSMGKYAVVSMQYYYYMMHSFDNTGKDELVKNTLGTSVINMVKPRITVRLYKDLSIGVEHNMYFNSHSERAYRTVNYLQTEQRVFLMFYWEDPQRKGHYN